MAPKRASLFGSKAATTSSAERVDQTATAVTDLPSSSLASGRPASRQGKKIVSAFVSAEASKQLRMLALKNDTTVQSLMIEALNDLFGKHGVNRIAE